MRGSSTTLIERSRRSASRPARPGRRRRTPPRLRRGAIADGPPTLKAPSAGSERYPARQPREPADHAGARAPTGSCVSSSTRLERRRARPPRRSFYARDTGGVAPPSLRVRDDLHRPRRVSVAVRRDDAVGLRRLRPRRLRRRPQRPARQLAAVGGARRLAASSPAANEAPPRPSKSRTLAALVDDAPCSLGAQRRAATRTARPGIDEEHCAAIVGWPASRRARAEPKRPEAFADGSTARAAHPAAARLKVAALRRRRRASERQRDARSRARAHPRRSCHDRAARGRPAWRRRSREPRSATGHGLVDAPVEHVPALTPPPRRIRVARPMMRVWTPARRDCRASDERQTGFRRPRSTWRPRRRACAAACSRPAHRVPGRGPGARRSPTASSWRSGGRSRPRAAQRARDRRAGRERRGVARRAAIGDALTRRVREAAATLRAARSRPRRCVLDDNCAVASDALALLSLSVFAPPRAAPADRRRCSCSWRALDPHDLVRCGARFVDARFGGPVQGVRVRRASRRSTAVRCAVGDARSPPRRAM